MLTWVKQYKFVLSNVEILSVTRLAIVCSSSFACTILSPFLFCCTSNCGALQAAIMGFLAMDTAVTPIAIMLHRLYGYIGCHLQLGNHLPCKCSIFLLLSNFITKPNKSCYGIMSTGLKAWQRTLLWVLIAENLVLLFPECKNTWALQIKSKI